MLNIYVKETYMIEKLVTDKRNRSEIYITEAKPICLTYMNKKLVSEDRNR